MTTASSHSSDQSDPLADYVRSVGSVDAGSESDPIQPENEPDGGAEIRLGDPVRADHLIGDWTSEDIYFRGVLAGTKLTERRLKIQDGAPATRVTSKVVLEVGVCQVSLMGATAEAVAEVWIRCQFEERRRPKDEPARSRGIGKY